MAYTWGEIKLESIKKMFLNNDIIDINDLNKMKSDNKYKIYLNAMAQAANEGIAECMKRGRPFIKTFEFTQNPIENSLGYNFKTRYYVGDEITVENTEARAYYFEVDNKAIVEVYSLVTNEDETEEWVLQETIQNNGTVPGKYTKYKNFSNTKGIKLVFKGDTVYSYRNVALYMRNYNIDNNDIKYIPDYKPYYIYDLSSLIPDFYKIDKLYFENYSHELINRTDYMLEDGNTLVIDDRLIGNFIMKYQCYPTKIDDETDDDDEINLPDEVAVILPLYIASQLYKDDDVALATQYRNEFETAVTNMYPRKDDTRFVSTTGWI